MNIIEDISFINPSAIVYDGLDSAIIGIAQRCGSPDVLAYDEDKIIQSLINDQGMKINEAIEYYNFNILNGYLGENTPIIIKTFNNES